MQMMADRTKRCRDCRDACTLCARFTVRQADHGDLNGGTNSR
ncbi:MAG: hypothetical protein AAF289_13295 [Cyanobacteria bacterium P01_A01_bin.135]